MATVPFDPLFRNPHCQTIAGFLWPRNGEEARFPLRRRLFRTEPEVEVLVESQYPEGDAAADIVLVHGLEGSGQAGYMRSLSGAALRAGFAAHRFHMRTCGGTEHLCRTLYHAGLTGDLRSVLSDLAAERRKPLYVVGFSLGGNVVLKLAGELGDLAGSLIAGVCAVSSPLDLAASSQRIASPENRLYEKRLVRAMGARLAATGRYSKADFAGLRSLLEIDDRITAPSFGFPGAAEYYRTQSALGYVDGLRVPALLIHAKDDTMTPADVLEHEAVRSNPLVTVLVTEHGGHLGFISRKPPRLWLDHAILNWITTRTATLGY